MRASCFYYSSADTQVLGLVLRGATGMPVADYLRARLWQPMGAEDDATWLVDAGGQEAVFAFLHARAARLRPARPAASPTTAAPAAGSSCRRPGCGSRPRAPGPHAQPFVASSYFGYGQQFWIFPGGTRRFAFIGVRGQAIFVDPALRLVLVQTAVWNTAGDRAARAELLALLARHRRAVRRMVKGPQCEGDGIVKETTW